MVLIWAWWFARRICGSYKLSTSYIQAWFNYTMRNKFYKELEIIVNKKIIIALTDSLLHSFSGLDKLANCNNGSWPETILTVLWSGYSHSILSSLPWLIIVSTCCISIACNCTKKFVYIKINVLHATLASTVHLPPVTMQLVDVTCHYTMPAQYIMHIQVGGEKCFFFYKKISKKRLQIKQQRAKFLIVSKWQ